MVMPINEMCIRDRVMCIKRSNIQLLSEEVMQILICGSRLHITVVGKRGDFLYGRQVQAEDVYKRQVLR